MVGVWNSILQFIYVIYENKSKRLNQEALEALAPPFIFRLHQAADFWLPFITKETAKQVNSMLKKQVEHINECLMGLPLDPG